MAADQTLLNLPAETLAYELLGKLPERSGTAGFRRSHEISYLAGSLSGAAARNIAAAFQVLVNDGVLVQWPPDDARYQTEGHADMLMLTAWGERVQKAGAKGRAMTVARRRLGVDLHPALAPKLRDSIAVGAFENAAWLALRSVESRVRKLSGDPRNDRGARLTAAPLMDHAFSAKNGVLSDPDVEQGEREGQLYLFKGTFLAVRNTLTHTDEEQWNDSIEAAEYVLLADLLMRRLDHVEQRIEREAKAEADAASARAAANAQAAGIVAVSAVEGR